MKINLTVYFKDFNRFIFNKPKHNKKKYFQRYYLQFLVVKVSGRT